MLAGRFGKVAIAEPVAAVEIAIIYHRSILGGRGFADSRVFRGVQLLNHRNHIGRCLIRIDGARGGCNRQHFEPWIKKCHT